MSSTDVKEQVNKICRLAYSLKDTETLCDAVEVTALEIDTNLRNAQVLGPEETEIIVDFAEIDRMQKENDEMKLLISDYHRGVELMMEAYRFRALNNVLEDEQNTERVEQQIYDCELLAAIHEQSNKIHEMRGIMQQAANAGDLAENSVVEQMAFLRKENATLRELYEISVRYGNGNCFGTGSGTGSGSSVGSGGSGIGNSQQSISMNIEDKTSQIDDEDDSQECSYSNDGDESEDDDVDVDGYNYDDADVITVISFKLHDSDADDDDDDENDVEKFVEISDAQNDVCVVEQTNEQEIDNNELKSI